MTDAIERVARDMIAILRGGGFDADEKDAAAETLLEALFHSHALTDEEREVLGNVADDARYRLMAYTEKVLRGLLRRLGGGK